jgi:hypothetical protein
MEDSAETSIAVFFGLQGIPNVLEYPQNPKVRYSDKELTFLYYFHSLLMLIAHTSILRLQIGDSKVMIF